jgi:hypothetical protein
MRKNTGKRCLVSQPSWREAIYAMPKGRHHKRVSLTIRFLRLIEPYTRIPQLPVRELTS